MFGGVAVTPLAVILATKSGRNAPMEIPLTTKVIAASKIHPRLWLESCVLMTFSLFCGRVLVIVGFSPDQQKGSTQTTKFVKVPESEKYSVRKSRIKVDP